MFSMAVAQKARKSGAPTGFRRRTARSAFENRDLEFAACGSAALGHIRPNGAVAEWLKAAVC
jgi:hypothetical protein